jgi:small subunit ribosomal protein S16
MAVKLRLSRVGTKHVPFYRIVAVDGRKPRDGAFLEDIGTWDAQKTQIVRFQAERYAYWVSQGAVPTDTVKKIHKLYQEKQ